MAVWRWSGVKRWLPRNVLKRNDMGGQRVVVESGGWGEQGGKRVHQKIWGF